MSVELSLPTKKTRNSRVVSASFSDKMVTNFTLIGDGRPGLGMKAIILQVEDQIDQLAKIKVKEQKKAAKLFLGEE